MNLKSLSATVVGLALLVTPAVTPVLAQQGTNPTPPQETPSTSESAPVEETNFIPSPEEGTPSTPESMEFTARDNPIVKRAKAWVDRNVPYSQSKTAYPNGNRAPSNKGFRTDCSGFVSMAWNLLPEGLAVPNTTTLHQYAKELNSADQLRPGDAINNRKPGNSGHVVLFVKWKNKNQGKFIAYEERGSKGAIQSELTLRRQGQDWSIKEFGTRHDPWHLQRVLKDEGRCVSKEAC